MSQPKKTARSKPDLKTSPAEVDAAEVHTYDEAKELTSLSLRKYLDTTDLTHLSLPELKTLADEIARIVPAGNVPTMISIGLANLKERVVPISDSRRNIGLLMQGIQSFVDKVKYSALFGGPAAVLTAYHMLLKLAGKDPILSFPEGTWQFYVEFGLREDTGWHACETIGFQTALKREGLKIEASDELAAWLSASAWLLTHYEELLACEWTERVRLRLLAEATDDPRLTERWLKNRPYSLPISNQGTDYITHRKAAFEQFCQTALNSHARVRRGQYELRWNDPAQIAQREQECAAYIKQMTIRANLTPNEHSDVRGLIPAEKLQIAVILNNRYYLIPVTDALENARPIAASLLNSKPEGIAAGLDRYLRVSSRRDQIALRRTLPEPQRSAVEMLRSAPIILNWDQANAAHSLAYIRNTGQRGIGDHALTIFRTNESAIFDVSHIFFDATIGMAIAEITTGQATYFARQIAALPRARNARQAAPLATIAPIPLNLPDKLPNVNRRVRPSEVSAENGRIRLDVIQEVRRNLQKRNERLHLTVNDLLLLYRGLYSPLYIASDGVLRSLVDLSASPDQAARKAAELSFNALDAARKVNPALLIPMDAMSLNPRERIFPTTFRNPFGNVYDLHQRTYFAFKSLDPQYTLSDMPRQTAAIAQQLRLDYLGVLQKFGEALVRYKDVSMKGESLSTNTIKLLAGLPPAVQRMLDGLPSHFDVLNDTLKGQEVFSNVGQVAVGSTLRRFHTAKDDNEKKTLAWGILTDAEGVMHVSLRDFRPHVAALIEVGQESLAQQMTQDYLDKFANGMNVFMSELLFIARARSPKE